ncbi:hypothetical protein [Cyanobium sp. ATX 6F1]|uniref:hypothetical protein n=1 Tax=Cyanobium sp. ATX 6F1 TaxID=2823702 RepID=UPI0020CE35B7|nr:hypothetical protein [Cyanobium sp. ATX 6F1]MCP9915699.1 hypothetical protein [Cyanobium sp. ATX 6F1]
MAARLAIGAIHVRPEVMEWIGQETLDRLLMRHRRGDWGLVDGRDARANTLAAYHQQGGLRSVYDVGGEIQVWIITGDLGLDSLHTTVLIPSDE